MAQELMSTVFAASKIQSGHKIERGDMFGLFLCPMAAVSSSGRELLHVSMYSRAWVGQRQCCVEAECLKAFVLACLLSCQGNDG